MRYLVSYTRKNNLDSNGLTSFLNVETEIHPFEWIKNKKKKYRTYTLLNFWELPEECTLEKEGYCHCLKCLTSARFQIKEEIVRNETLQKNTTGVIGVFKKKKSK